MNESAYTFPKKHRLRKASEFSKIFSKGERNFAMGLMLVSQRSLSPSAPAKLGFALSKRVLRLAHERKRLKRLAIEYFRHRKSFFIGREFVLTLGRSFRPEPLRSSSEMEVTFSKLWRKYQTQFSRASAEDSEELLQPPPLPSRNTFV